jgi:DNA-directed RNA polymerase specialized sigma24 family protein
LEARVKSAIKIYDYLKETREMQNEIHNKEIEIAEAKTIYFQHQLNKKNREMLVSAVNIFQNKKLITVIKSEIFKEITEISETQKLQLIRVLDRFENISNSINWDVFEVRFTELNEDFYTKIQIEFPNLSSNEVRLCALLKLGLSPKEIATINYSSYEAIRKAIYRIRKKIKIQEKTDLNMFFQAY